MKKEGNWIEAEVMPHIVLHPLYDSESMSVFTVVFRVGVDLSENAVRTKQIVDRQA